MAARLQCMDESQTYLTPFGLREQPFAPTADPAYFYATREHKECLFRLWNSIDSRQGIAVVLGGYGTGKTTLLRKLLVGMRADPRRYNTAVVGSPIPSWTSLALLDAIVTQFGLRSETPSIGAGMDALYQYLLAHRDQINTLIIDDSQNLNKRGQIELLRLIQNIETQQHKLLNLVLFAQIEWVRVLRAAPNFEQRIDMSYTLQPIHFEEMRRFIEYRLECAGARPGAGPEFDEAALRAIHAYAEGNPRLIVTLCRNALLLAAQLNARRVNPDLILHTIEKTTVPNPDKRARVAAAVMEGFKGRAPAAKSFEPANDAGDDAQWDRWSRDQRATQLLLRGARSRQGPR